MIYIVIKSIHRYREGKVIMMSVRGLFCFVTILGFIQYLDALGCYQCGDSDINGPCVTDTATMMEEFKEFKTLNTSTSMEENIQTNDDDGKKKTRYKYLKTNCSETSNACIIERIEELGLLHAYIRDCFTTGQDYSVHDPRFDIDETKNQTMCVYTATAKRLSCVSVCNTDYCNGPQFISGSSSFSQNIRLWFISFMASFVVLLHFKVID